MFCQRLHANVYGWRKYAHSLLVVLKRLTSTKQLIPSTLPPTKQLKLIPTVVTASANAIACGH